MTARRVVGAIALAGTFAVAIVGCGEDNGGTIVDGTTSTGDGAGGESSTTRPEGDRGVIELTVTRTDTGEVATLNCNNLSMGASGFISALGQGDAACDLVAFDAGARRRLIEGPEKGIMCTQQYGGPETADVTGTIDGETVDTSFHRSDGCGIADWEMLESLLGPPGQ